MTSRLSETRHFYDRKAHVFDRKWRRYNNCTYRLASLLLSQLEETPKYILDIGCGSGNVLAILRDRFPSAVLTGIDPSPAMLERARTKVPDAKLLVGDIFSAPRQSFDLLTAVSMFHYVADPEHWLTHAAGLLSSQGMLLLIDWNGSAPLMRMREQRLLCIPHIKHVYTEQEMGSLLREWNHSTHTRQSCCLGWWSVQGHLARPIHKQQ